MAAAFILAFMDWSDETNTSSKSIKFCDDIIRKMYSLGLAYYLLADLAAGRVSEGATGLSLGDCPRLVAGVLQHHPHLRHDEVQVREVSSLPLGED